MKNWDWRKVPSVTTGGKPFFFVAFHEDNTGRTKTTVVWDRIKAKWAVEMNDQVIDYFDTATEGRKFAQFGRAIVDGIVANYPKGGGKHEME